RAPQHCEASRKHTAVDVTLELIPHELGQWRGETLLDGGVERVKVVAHDLVQGALLRTPTRVRWLADHGRCWRNGRARRRDASAAGGCGPQGGELSLTELRDSLSQWSRYGDNGAGVALGFAIQRDKLPGESNKPWRTATELTRVRYDGASEDDASKNLRPLVLDVLAKYLPKFGDPTEIQNTLIALMHNLSPIVKRASYYEEREWRLIVRTVVESVEIYEIDNN